MCEPVTLTAISLGLTAASGAVGAVGAAREGEALEAQAEHEAAIARQNAQRSAFLSRDAVRRGEEEAAQINEQTAQIIGQQRAGLSANGVLVDRDSAAGLIGDTAALGAEDAAVARRNAAREAFGFRVQGTNLQNQANLADARGDSARSAGNLAAATQIVGTASSLVGDAFTAQQSGVFRRRRRK